MCFLDSSRCIHIPVDLYGAKCSSDLYKDLCTQAITVLLEIWFLSVTKGASYNEQTVRENASILSGPGQQGGEKGNVPWALCLYV